MKTYIVNPDNNKLVPIEDWRKDPRPERAQLLAIETDDDHLLLVSKSYLPCGEVDWEKAQKACAEFKPMEGITFRCPTRKECIDLYDARFQGLDEAVELTGGNYAHRKEGNWYWTADRDADPNYAYYAWCSGGSYGCMGNNFVYITALALPVTLLK